MTPLQSLMLDIDLAPHLTHPLVGAFIDPSLELTEMHINCIYDAIQYAQQMMYEGEKK